MYKIFIFISNFKNTIKNIDRNCYHSFASVILLLLRSKVRGQLIDYLTQVLNNDRYILVIINVWVIVFRS